MNDKINLKELEKKAWISTFQDGLWDIYFGLFIMGLGLAPLGRFLGLPETIGVLILVISWDMIAGLVLILGKIYISRPRIGFVKFGQIRKKRNKLLAIFLGINVGLTVIVFIFTLLGMFQLQLPGYMVMLVIGLLFITTPFSFIAYFIQLKRVYLYALLGGLGLFFSEILNPILNSPFNDLLVFVPLGGLILIFGIIILNHFLSKYQLVKKEVP
ncbi:MAG: hypothetical protein EU542_00435 [Promethearchaeota archaeon]|nr:MAG: hypothetical protein EU542_00435 [Candidatus Lokiarchaeota archaeon]